MVKVKPLDAIAEKWVNVTPGRAPFYEQGIREAAGTWASNAAAAEPNYQQGVQQAISRRAYSKGVRAAGDEKWQRKALELGTARYGQGVQAARDDFSKGFAPYHDVIARIVLPKRGPRGSPGNYDRVRALGEALHKRRTGGASTAGGGT